MSTFGEANSRCGAKMTNGVRQDEWDEGKRAHVRLSDAAASTYDDQYKTANFATGMYMQFEESSLRAIVKQAPSRTLAVDLGCGTGRHTLMLADTFSLVYGYDISQGMIDQANKAKIASGKGNVQFSVADIDSELPDLAAASADLVSCSFGMGSFVRDLKTLFETVRYLLKPGGVVAFSWYNRDGIVNSIELPWIPALAARMLPGTARLRVEYGGVPHDISAMAYSVAEITRNLEANFQDVAVTTFPTLTAMFPQDLFEQDAAKAFCSLVDDNLVNDVENCHSGHYIYASARKGGRRAVAQASGHHRVEELLRILEVEPRRHEHRPLRNMAEVREEFPDLDPAIMVKGVLMAKQRGDRHDPQNDDLVLCLVSADTQVDTRSLAKLFGYETSRKLHMLSPIDLETRTGFSVGAIPPFGMPPRVQVIVDSAIAEQPVVWTGSGRATESFEMPIEDLLKLSLATVASISRKSNKR